MQDHDRNKGLDERVEAYLTGRLSEADEAAFCEELLESTELQQQVMEAVLLRDGLAERSAPNWRSRWWLPAAAAAVVGIFVGSVFLSRSPDLEPVITGAPFTVAGQVRGRADVLVVPSHRNGITLLFPGGRCKAIELIEIFGPGGKVVASSRVREEVPGFALTLPEVLPGHYRADITYADCPFDSRQFFVAPGEGSSIPKSAELFEGTWTVQPGATTGLVSPGGEITIEFEYGAEGPMVSISAAGMGKKDEIWNQATGLMLEDDAVTGELVHNGKSYSFTISRHGDTVHCKIVPIGVLAKDEDEGGGWTGE